MKQGYWRIKFLMVILIIFSWNMTVKMIFQLVALHSKLNLNTDQRNWRFEYTISEYWNNLDDYK